MTKAKTASFRIDQDKWDEFIAKAESNGLTGSKIIVDAIDRYIAGTYPPLTQPSRKPRSVGSREEMAALSHQLAAAVAQIEQLANGQTALLKEVEELKSDQQVRS
jgi:hypothetical protein